MDKAVYLVICTAAEAAAETLATRLLDERLVACVNLLSPMTSHYVWKGRVEKSQEVLMLMKTTGELRHALRHRLVELHDYEVPEILEFRADSGLESYVDWVARSCRGAQ